MKKFVKYLLTIAICAAALLSSCIKEENFKRDTVQLNVTLTRSNTTPGVNDKQGDKIEDATLWAFEYTSTDANGIPVIADDAKARGYRYVDGITNTYGSIGLHVPLPTCEDSANYLIVAVVNRSAFGSNFTLGQSSTWKEVREANFAADGAFWSVYPQSATPELMPVSNWAAFTINSGNVHEMNSANEWKCYNLDLPVYRAVAKSQLFMAKAGDFTLTVLDAKIVANNGYSNGKVLTYNSVADTTKSEVKGSPAAVSTPWWWTEPTTATSLSYQLYNGTASNNPTWSSTVVSQTGSAETPQSNDFQWVGSTFLLENDAVAGTLEERNAGHDSRVGNGYNLYVKYSTGDKPEDIYEVYTPLGQVVRNNDYQVKATVNAVGELNFTIEVVDWKQEDIVMNYENTVTIQKGGYIAWEEPLPGGVYTNGGSASTPGDGRILSGQIDMTQWQDATAVCTFALETPQYGQWHAELRTIKGVTGAIAFFDPATGANLGISTSGPISNAAGEPQQAKLVIKNVANNLAAQGSSGDNVVELRIYATGIAGVYQIPNLPGVFVDDGNPATDDTEPVFSYYTLTQPRK